MPTVNFFPEANMKPKFYFLRHYAMIKRFGPLVKTLKFEVKHQYLKWALTKNFHHAKQILAVKEVEEFEWFPYIRKTCDEDPFFR